MYVFSVTQHRYRVVMIDNMCFQFATVIDIFQGVGGQYCDININTLFGLYLFFFVSVYKRMEVWN